MSSRNEVPIIFDCEGDRLTGIIHRSIRETSVGAVIVVGGPQYRVGSHRQFVQLARCFASNGINALRFDCRGMGDSEGVFPGFEFIEPDIEAAVKEFTSQCPSVKHIFLIGLCDGASAILMSTVARDLSGGLILINPWVRSDSLEARAYVKHYYFRRIVQKSFWTRLFSGKMQLRAALSGLLGNISESVRRENSKNSEPDFVTQMLLGFERIRRPSLVILSGRDLTARQFDDLCSSNREWDSAMRRGNVSLKRYPEADHTFSKSKDLFKMSIDSLNWIESLDEGHSSH